MQTDIALPQVTAPSSVLITLGRRIVRLVTVHRVLVLVCMATTIVALYKIQALLWPHTRSPHGLWEDVWGWGALLWLGAVVPGALGLIGMMTFRHPRDLDTVRPIPNLVSWRIVSRGTNVDALTATIRRCQREMAATPLFDYVIEVVTDCQNLDLEAPNWDIRYIQVPPEYTTPKGSLFKARALHYALENSEIPADAWIVHLDEETHPTPSGIKGIARAVAEEEHREAATGMPPRIGQGALLYHRDWRRHPILTLADNVRTGDDFARFHFQHRLGRTVFGLHGSYVVVRNDIEKVGGFDFGPVGSITEDAFWALVCMEAGIRCRWVEGYLEEQSTQSLKDFVFQRRRWYQGLAKVSLFAPVTIKWRICLGINTALWSFAPFALMYTIAHMFYGFATPGWVHFLANASFASFTTLYLIGLRANLREHGITHPVQRLLWAAAQVALLPIFSAIEACGVLLAIVKPAQGFHVVAK